MNKEKIQALIFSDVDEKEIARKLINWFIKYPDLINERYLVDRTVFHLLVLKNKSQALKLVLEDTTWKLFEDESWQKVAALPDRSGCTPMHYAARSDESYSATLNILLEYTSTKINYQNNNRNTALHEAVLAGKLWAVKALVAANCDRSILNHNDKTALDLAVNNTDLKQALLTIDLRTIKSLDLGHRTPSTDTMDSLRDSFPLLSSERTSSYSSSPASSSLESLSSRSIDPITSEPGVLESSLELEEDWEEDQSVTNAEVFSLLRRMVSAYQENKRSASYLHLQKQFNALCLQNLLPDGFDLSQEPLFKQNENREVLLDAINILYPSVEKHYSRNKDTGYKLLKNFIYTIIPHISIADSEPRAVPVLDSGPIKEKTTLEVLWLLTAGQQSRKSKREIKFDVISDIALGILSSLPLINLIVNLRKLYPHFDKDQKIVANFIVLQMIYYNGINKVRQETNIDLQLKLLSKLNVDEKHGLGDLGKLINHHLNQIHNLSSVYSRSPLLRNYYILNQEVNRPFMVRSFKSFDAIVDQALTKNRRSRVDEVQIIARDLRMLTFSDYQQVSITEFHDKNWEKKDICPNEGKDHICDNKCVKVGKSTLSPHIVKPTENFNKLNSYFLEKILAQPAGNLKNALQFIIEIGKALCPLTGEQYPDLNHLMVITSVLGSNKITRLNAVKELSTKDRASIAEIEKMVCKVQNSKCMRDLYKAKRTTLPFLGVLLTDITFANENSDPLNKLGAIGAVLKKLMELKLLLNFERADYQTNLPVMLDEYAIIDDELMYNASLRQQLRKADVIQIDNTLESFSIGLDNLTRDYLSVDLIPSVVTNKKTYQPEQIPSLLIDLFGSKIKTFKKEADKNQLQSKEKSNELPLLLTILNKLQIAIPQLIKILNTYYVPLKLSDFKPIALFMTQLDELKQQIEPTEALPEHHEAKEIPKSNSMRRRSAHFMERHGIFKVSDESPIAGSSTNLNLNHGNG